jgi:hypothetical protein
VPKVFISYKHGAPLDVRLANSTLERLRQTGNDVFIDSQIKVGDEWPTVIEQKLKESDYFIVFLSSESAVSEMVIEEVKIARRVRKDVGRPKILPVRVAYEQPLPYDLGAWLDRLQQAFWRTDADDSHILDLLVAAMGGSDLPSNAPHPVLDDPQKSAPLPAFDPRWLDALDSGDGAMRTASPFYIERDLDQKAKRAVTKMGETILIRGSRQSGKSSALARICQHARNNGQQILFVDFQAIDKSKLQDTDTLFRYLAELIYAKLRTAEGPARYWGMALGPTDKLSEFMENEVLQHAAKPFVLALDEVDRIFAHPEYFNQFFGLLRSWHNRRAFDDSWTKLNLVLAYSTESSLLIQDQNQSPFNVGEAFESVDFTREQVMELNHRHGSPLRSPAEIDAFMRVVSGHPYLVRKALFEMVSGGRSLGNLTGCAADDDGPFGDHLRRSLIWLAKRTDLKAAFKSVLSMGVCDTDLNFYKLRAGGLVRGHSREGVQVRCGLYHSYFAARL